MKRNCEKCEPNWQSFNSSTKRPSKNRLLTQVKSESKDRDAAREWERKDAIRQGELDIMHDKLDRTMRELSEKEARIQQLQEKLSEGDKRRGSALGGARGSACRRDLCAGRTLGKSTAAVEG